MLHLHYHKKSTYDF